MGEDDKIKTLVGIVAEVRATLEDDPPAHAYYPYWQRVPDGAALVVRTSGDPTAVTASLRTALRSEDAQLPIPPDPHHGRGRRWVGRATAIPVDPDGRLCRVGAPRGQPWHLRRRRVLGGAPAERARHPDGARRPARATCFGLVIRQGMTPVVIGLAAGVTVALLLGQTIRGLLFDSPADRSGDDRGSLGRAPVRGRSSPVSFPARRAASTDAVAALRIE